MIDRSGVIKIVVLIHSLMGGGLANATDLVVNNGLAPPAPSNVFSTDLVSIDHIHVQDVGCDVTVLDPCATPGLSTTIETLSGALILEIVSHQTSRLVLTGGNIIEAQARDQSAIDLNGASVFGMHTFDDARVVMADGGLLSIDARDRSDAHFASGFIGGAGILMGEFVARDSASITLAGGTSDPMDRYLAYGAGTITFIGSNFRVDGSSVPYGPIAAQTGTLTGTFESGAAIDNPFYQGGSASPVCQPGPCTGTIILAPGRSGPVHGRLGERYARSRHAGRDEPYPHAAGSASTIEA
jgi:hypothetical protein